MNLNKENTCRTCLNINLPTLLTPLNKKICIDNEIINLKEILQTCSNIEVGLCLY